VLNPLLSLESFRVDLKPFVKLWLKLVPLVLSFKVTAGKVNNLLNSVKDILVSLSVSKRLIIAEMSESSKSAVFLIKNFRTLKGIKF
jgi:hypothetical protein